MTQIEFNCPVVNQHRLNDQFVILTLKSAAICDTAQPGQFVNLSCQEFLRRPFGIMAIDRATNEFQVGIQIKGKGTKQLAGLKIGDIVSILGPLGHGFDMTGARRIITVGGGTGVFPLYFVHQTAKELGIERIAICGYRSVEDAILRDEFKAIANRTVFASDTGGLDVIGHAGHALQIALEQLASNTIGSQPTLDQSTFILTCGPKIMMQKVAEMALANGLSCQVSLEEHMGCGIGICLVCVCKIKNHETAEINHQRCCVEGPVFAAEDVVW
ncbi:MAG: dihydroorotate dehydrogenase electron transfer subunit [Eubacteriales bacterium]|nr:dihydroorotate dehydrogenase electron transfer subunit [Eubacteriales bacterium]